MDNNENKYPENSNGEVKQRQYYYESNVKTKKKMPSWIKAIIIIVAVILGIVLLTKGCSNAVEDFISGFSSGIVAEESNEVTTDFGHDYIGTVYVEGTIQEGSNDTYNHQYILNSIDAMMEDSENKGIILYVDTPGGSVYAADELYFKIKEYQEKTKRPVYSSMQSMAASGGYYISAPCDKIIANRNCWTGSIGVTLGTIYDISGLLDKMGIKTQTITSGANKAMGGSTEPMTKEQKEIFQSMVDEAYEQFTGIVAQGRNMDVSKVKKLADGRIYTAKQAVENGLVDQIGTYQEAINDMKKEYKLDDCEVEEFKNYASTSLRDILGISSGLTQKQSIADADSVKELAELNGTFELNYISEIRK